MNSKIFPFLSLVAIVPATAVETVFTEPVGYVKLGNTEETAPAAVPANTEVYLTVPLERSLRFSGIVDSVTPADGDNPTIVHVAGSPSWSDDEWFVPNGSGAPFVVVVSSGSQNGVRGLIYGNSSASLEVVLPQITAGDLNALSSGDSFEIRKAWTLESFFEPSNPPSQTTVFVYNETASGINQVAPLSTRFTFNGTDWRNLFNQNGNDTVLCPGETFVLRTGSAGLPSLAVFGDVPLSQFRIDLAKDSPGSVEEHLVASASPVPLLVSELGLPAAEGDVLFYYDNKTTGINKVAPLTSRLTYTAGLWKNVFNQDVSNSFTIAPGVGFRIRRAENSPDDAEWIQATP